MNWNMHNTQILYLCATVLNPGFTATTNVFTAIISYILVAIQHQWYGYIY